MCGTGLIWEDYLVHYANLLGFYKNYVFKRWKSNSPVKAYLGEELFQSIGDGIISFLKSQAGEKRPITKTPSANNLECFFKLFPRMHLLIVIRDGRSVTESGKISFGGNYEIWMRKWVEGAKAIISFDRGYKNSNFKYLIVRYEDLYINLEQELRKILDFLGLSVQSYDFRLAANLPLRGSSDIRKYDKRRINWEPMKKPADFDPLGRWKTWRRSLHERFNWIAGKYLTEFGYEKKYYRKNRLLWHMWNRIMDIKLAFMWKLRQFKRTSILREYDSQ